ncbi:MAG: glycoside hydrolase family 18 protein [Thermoanaerobaculia bacterium]
MSAAVIRARLIVVLLLAVVSTGCTTLRPWQREPRYRIIAYVMGRADIDAIDARKLTHVNYAFAKVSEAGEVVFEDPASPGHIARLQALKAKNPRLEVLVSVGGWGADHFSDAALTPESRAKFAASAVAMLHCYGLDGIDLDWEYPGQPGPGIEYRPEDRENFTLLLAAVREALDVYAPSRRAAGRDPWLLTIASAAGSYFRHTEMDRLHVYLDWINVMTYDFFTPGSPTTGHHTGLYRVNDRPTYSVEDYVRQHIEAGIPREKIVVGAAFYGRGFTGVAPENHGLYQPYEKYASSYSFSKLAAEYLGRHGFERHWDEAARAPWLWNAETATFISYDDPASIREKARFVRRHGLGGIMYWEHSHDPDEVLLTVLYHSLR